MGRGWRSKAEDNLEMAIEFFTFLRRGQERGCMTTTTEMIGAPGEGPLEPGVPGKMGN